MATAELLETPVESESAPVETVRRVWTALEVLERFGPIPMSRLRHNVEYGTATEEDVLRLEGAREKSLCELIEGVLLEKTVGAFESAVTVQLVLAIALHVRTARLGTVLTTDGYTRFRPDKVYVPDVCFIPNERLTGDGLQPEHAISPFIPTLAVEVLSPSNTRREMEAKLQDYFASGVLAVWLVDTSTKSIRLHDAPDSFRTVKSGESFDAGPVLPGLVINVASLFDVNGRGAG